ncbi:hypothetical protein [Treponema succinifaciens]|uniref:hypothetical protein n=1 Tax=Treponema succinifaciens TaxID=167 RepID=UPI003FCD802B
MTTLTKPRKELWGGVIEFPDLEPGKYTATAEAWNLGENILEGSGSTEITVRAGETTDCNIAMILEGQTAYYSKYMILTDYSNTKYIYDYPSCNKSSKSVSFGTSYNTVEDNNGQIYHIEGSNLYKDNDSVLNISDTSKLIKNPLYYDSKTDTYWIGLEKKIIQFQFCLQNSDKSGNTEAFGDPRTPQGQSFLNFAVQENKVYLIYIDYEDSSDPNIIYFTKDENVKLTEQKRIQLSTIGVSGEVTDMAVLEDGTVAVLVNEKSLNPANQFTLNDGCTVYSRGALVLLSSDLSTYKVYGWTDSPRTISAKLNSGSDDPYNGAPGNSQIDSITAYIPDYAERNSHFYGPMRIVAIRPKELVIADCGANFVLADYNEKKNGKMFTHNRLMTVNLRNFAIDCKKEFSEDELKFQNLTISGNLEYVTAGWTDLSAENEK